MKRLFIIAALAAAATASVFASDAGVPLSTGLPGFYGRIDVGGYPQPQLIYSQPIAVQRVSLSRQPIYLHVRPGHASNWRKHCHTYDACGERVLFVHNDWYSREYVPRYLERYYERRNGHRGGQYGKSKSTIKTMIVVAEVWA